MAKEREDRLDSAAKKLDVTVGEFRSFVEKFGSINKDIAKEFQNTLSFTEKAQIDVFAAAQKIQTQFNSVFDGMENAGDEFTAQGAFVTDEILKVTKKSFEANKSEARQLRKDLESLRSSAAVLSGEERKKVEGLINIATDELKAVSGGVSVFREAVNRRFDPANMVEKLFGGGLIGGMFGDMVRISRERKKTAALTEMKTSALGVGGDANAAVLDELSHIRESLFTMAQPEQSALQTEEKEREAARNKIAGVVGKGEDNKNQTLISHMLSTFFFTPLLTAFAALWLGFKTYLFAPLWAGISHFVLLPIKTLFLKFLIAPLSAWGNAFIAKLAASKMWGAISGVGKRAAGSGIGQAIIGKRFAGGQFMPGGAGGIHGGQAVAGGQRSGVAGFLSRGIQKIKGAPAASRAARAPTDLVSGAAKSAGKATSAVGAGTAKTPKKGILKSLADGIKAFGRKGIMKGILNLGLLAIAMIPFAIAMKLFSSGVTMGGILAFAASITVLVVAVKALSKMGTEVVKGALALSILGVAIIPLAIGLALMKDVGIGTIFVLAGALLVLGVAASIFGSMAANPFFWLGILAIAALGVALLPLAFAMKIAAEAFKTFTEALDIEKMLALGPMLMFAAPGLLAFGLAAWFAAPGLLALSFALAIMSATGGGQVLSAILEELSIFSQTVKPQALLASAAGIIALGAALLVFVAAGVAAQAIATAGGVAMNFMTLGGLLGAPAPGPFDMLKMFIAFGEHGEGIAKGADGIDKLKNSMMSFANIDTEGMKTGVAAMVEAIDEFSAAAFKAAFYGGIGNFLLGADPLDKFIMMAEVGPGLQKGADGIKRLGEAFSQFAKVGESGAIDMFKGGWISDSAFENLIEDLGDAFDELNVEEWEAKIAVLERLTALLNQNTAGGATFTTNMEGLEGDDEAAGIAGGTTNPNLRAEIKRRGEPSTATAGYETEGVGTATIAQNRDPRMRNAAMTMAKGQAKLRAQGALADELGVGVSDLPPGVKYDETTDKENQLVTTIAYIGKKVEAIDGKITGKLSIKELRQQVKEDEEFFGEGNSPWQEDLDKAEAKKQGDAGAETPRQEYARLRADYRGEGGGEGGGEQFTGGRRKAAELREGTVLTEGTMAGMGGAQSDVRTYATKDGIKSVVKRPVTRDGIEWDKSMARNQAYKALAVELGIPGAKEGKFSVPPGVQMKIRIEEIDGQNFIIAEADYSKERTQAVAKLRDEMNAMGGSKGGPGVTGRGGPGVTGRRPAPIGSSPTEAAGANAALSENAALGAASSGAGGRGGGDITVAPINAPVINTSTDNVYAHNPTTRNPESTLQRSHRNSIDDAIL